MKDFYTVKEVEKELNIMPPAVRRLIREGKLKASLLNGSYIIDKESYKEFLEKRGK